MSREIWSKGVNHSSGLWSKEDRSWISYKEIIQTDGSFKLVIAKYPAPKPRITRGMIWKI